MQPKSVLITGASRGLGRALVTRFSRAGWRVAASMLDQAEAPDVKALPGVTPFTLDVADLASIERGVRDVLAAFGSIDLLINNAGYGSFAVVESASEAQIRKLYATNALGPVFVTRAVIPHMRERGSGTLMFVSSSIASMSAPFHGMYGACKWATTGFAEGLVYELKPLGIRVKIAAPGAMATSYFEHTDDKLDGVPAAYAKAVAGMKAGLPRALAGAPTPDEVAEEVFRASTDGTDQVHYLVTEQARRMIGYRRQVGDEAWLQEAVNAFSNNQTVAVVGEK
jgi:NAD(P)-dependent dehydrogenase (short-subunit alcohol dehydrogenase family)